MFLREIVVRRGTIASRAHRHSSREERTPVNAVRKGFYHGCSEFSAAGKRRDYVPLVYGDDGKSEPKSSVVDDAILILSNLAEINLPMSISRADPNDFTPPVANLWTTYRTVSYFLIYRREIDEIFTELEARVRR